MRYRTLNCSMLFAFIFFFFSCKKDVSLTIYSETQLNQTQQPSVLLIKITGPNYYDETNIYYDSLNKPIRVTKGTLGYWVSKIDVDNNITEIRDTGVAPGGFSPYSFIKEKSVFYYNSNQQIILCEFYDLNGDSTIPLSFIKFSYAKDSVISEVYLREIDASILKKSSTTTEYFVKQKNLINSIYNYDSVGNNGYFNFRQSSHGRFQNLKNPITLLPPSIGLATGMEPILYFSHAGTIQSKFLPAKSTYYSKSFSSFSNSYVTSEASISNDYEESMIATGYPKLCTQAINSRYTVLATGAITKNSNVFLIEYTYIIK